MSTEDRIRQFIVGELRYSGAASDLTAEYPLLENEVVDSLGLFELVSHLEETYGVEIADDDLVPENFESIASIARLVDAKRAA